MIKCVITAASNFSDENFSLLCEKVRERFGSDVEISHNEDNSIIGGFILNIDGMIYDMSISAQISEMKKFLKGE